MKSEYIDAAEVAKLIRKRLKAVFPGVKFSVRTSKYSMGASINVAWTDGPTSEMVDPIVKVYAGGGFDGMIDLAYSNTAWLLPDGTATLATSEGTEGSAGVIPREAHWMPDPEAKLVRFGSDYVFTNREFSAAFLARRLERAKAMYRIDPDVEIVESSIGAYLAGPDCKMNVYGREWSLHEELAIVVGELAHKTAGGNVELKAAA